MTNILMDFYNNKLLFYGVIAVFIFIIISIILIKKLGKNKKEDKQVAYQKVDGNESLFDKVLEKTEENNPGDNKLDLESMIEQMQKDLDAKASEVVEKFENDQEEKSVISYQELLKEKKENEKEKEIVTSNKDDFLNEVIDDFSEENSSNESVNNSTLKETYVNALKLEEDNTLDSNNIIDEIDKSLVSKLNNKDEFINALKNGDFEEKIEENKEVEKNKIEINIVSEIEDPINATESKNKNDNQNKFKATEFISPIYGVQDIKIQYPTVQNMKEFRNQSKARNYNKFELGQTINMEPISDDIRKNEDFLNALKEFRKNLE